MVKIKKIKVLWFTNTPVDYYGDSSGYNGGGWMLALKDEIIKTAKIELAISFYGSSDDLREVMNNVSYYPISFDRKMSARLKRVFSKTQQETDHLNEFKRVIDSFKPDLIHVFGTEKPFGLVAKHTDVPTVIHLQGLIIPYLNALLPPQYSKLDFFIHKGLGPWSVIKNIRSYFGWKDSAVQEKKIFEGCKNFMGRTHWDRAICKILAPNSSYFYCGEILRPEFSLVQGSIKRDGSQKTTIVSTISDPLYKGADMILKTANVLKDTMNLEFEWLVFGVKNIDFASSKLAIEGPSNGVKIKGVVSVEDLITSLSTATAYVHPSYIDNSPNSICEAQVLGVPVVACNVGGVSSLISHSESGFLSPANDPFMLAYYIKYLIENPDHRDQISRNAHSIAIKRHNPSTVIGDLFKVYRKILN